MIGKLYALPEQDAIRTAIKEMQRGGVNVDAAPKEAVEMAIDAKLPPAGKALRGRGTRRLFSNQLFS